MPIYDYTCRACGSVTEVIHGIHDQGPRYCPSCGAEGTMRKALTAPAIVFKGSGWAKVDRRSSSGGTGASRSAKPRAGASDGGATSGGGASGEPTSGSGSSETAGATGGTASSNDGGGD